MQFYFSLNNVDPRKKRAITIGNFDGIHLGHQRLLNQLVKTAKSQQLTSSLLTFEPQPLEYLKPSHAPERLTSLREKIIALQQLTTIDEIICLPFHRTLANLSADEFVDNILINALNCSTILVGKDFRYGKARQGDIAHLTLRGKEKNFTVDTIKTVTNDNERISSTRIRQLLQKGDFAQTQALLGRPYCLTGRVIHGDKRARELGFPTANLPLRKRKLSLHGVFAVTVQGKNLEKKGVANLGWRPTVDGKKQLLEIHLFDFTGDLYGQCLTVYFHQKIRDEKKFASLEELKKQIHIDVETAQEYYLLNSHNFRYL